MYIDALYASWYIFRLCLLHHALLARVLHAYQPPNELTWKEIFVPLWKLKCMHSAQEVQHIWTGGIRISSSRFRGVSKVSIENQISSCTPESVAIHPQARTLNEPPHVVQGSAMYTYVCPPTIICGRFHREPGDEATQYSACNARSKSRLKLKVSWLPSVVLTYNNSMLLV